MPDASVTVPEGYEILRTIDSSDSAGEYLARHKADGVLVRLKVCNFSKTSGATTRRVLREYLRCDVTFMEELDDPGVIRIFDYSDTKNMFWVATQPAEIDKLSKRFDFLASQSFEFRQGLVRQLLTILQRIHNQNIVHRNLSSDAVFLSPELEIYIGDFGFASYFSDQSTTHRDATLVTTTAYQPPEIRDAKTFTCNVSCDIFSAGLLAFEILSATALPKDKPGEIEQTLRAGLNEQVAKEAIDTNTAEVILKAVDASPEKRWSSAEDFANALEESLRDKSGYIPMFGGPASTIGVTQPAESQQTVPISPDIAKEPLPPAEIPTKTAEGITPLDPSHEIWNNHYEIIEKIGEGGQAVVYKAYDHLTNEEIAIKTIWSRHRGDQAAINRLKQGAMIARSLTHRYIIKTYSVEQRIDTEGAGKYVFICMELIKSRLELGDVIEERRASGKKIRLDETLHIIRQLLDALTYAHEYTIHRDIKPGNIMLVARGEQAEVDSSDLKKFDIRLIDFGIAKVLSQKHIDVTGKGFRSAHYGAPELADSKTAVDARADIYSAGVIMYQMLTLNIPRKGSPPANKVNKDVPAALAKVIDRAVIADREKRFKSISEFAKEIDRAVSKFNWVRKAAKAAAVLLVAVFVAAGVKYFLPEPDYVPIQQSMEILKNREPDKEIAAFANGGIVTFSDIEGYTPYDSLRQTALEKLDTVKMAGSDKFKLSFTPWKEQQELWVEIEPAVEKIERIAQDQQEYNARKDIDIVEYLINLNPSSEIVSEARDKAERAETLLEARPLPLEALDICVSSYDLAAKVYTNIDTLASGSDTPDTAEEINNKLKDVEKLRDDFLVTRNSLDVIEQLEDYGFDERSEKCLEKADRYYQSFDIRNAGMQYGLLNQICGTILHVRDQINFNRSDIGLISSRLMDLCYEDIETFENYPAWTEKLGQVYKKKDILAKYKLLQGMLTKGPRGVPLNVYNLIDSALKYYEGGNLNSADTYLTDATEEYKKYMRRKIDNLTQDCDSLLSFPSVSVESIKNSKSGLERLLHSIDEPSWPRTDFIDEYNRHWRKVSTQKDAIRKQLAQQGKELREKIINSSRKAQQESFFWNSRRINKYIAAAQQYESDDIDTSIANWQYIENLARLSAIVNQMQNLDSRLHNMLTRKGQLDRLADGIDEGISFCEKFTGTTDAERKQYKQWQSDLKQLRAKLTAPQNNTYLIDQHDEIFNLEYTNIESGFLEIRAKLPYHRRRVIELMNKSHLLEENASRISKLQQHWADILVGINISTTKPDFSQMRAYLDGVKEDVDKWSADHFNKQMRSKCEMLGTVFAKQNQTIDIIISGINGEKSRLIEGIESFEKKANQILSDNDIRTLNEIAANDRRQAIVRFRQLPVLLNSSKQKLSDVVLDRAATSLYVMPEGRDIDFKVDGWFEKFNSGKDGFDTLMRQLQAAENTVEIFQETRQLLAQQSSMETVYYQGLRDSTIGLIDYSDASDKIEAIEADSIVIKMCNFLEQMENDTVPRLGVLKASIASIDEELAGLRVGKISTLSEAKDFNRNREQLLGRIETLRQNVGKLDRRNLENSCRQSVAHGVDKITNLIGSPEQTDTLKRITSSLWAFFPDHQNWSQWGPFLKQFHIVVSGEDVRLTLSNLLKPTNEKGEYLSLTEIAANSTKVFYTDAGSLVNFGWPVYISHQKDPSVILAFVPGTQSGDIKPFYMAIREITNAQYKMFLEKSGAKSTTNLAGWSYFSDQDNNLLIGQAQGQFPPCRIRWDKFSGVFAVDEEFKHAPVTWVTSSGGQAYAQWFDAQLPTSSQHAHASHAGSNTRYPWGNKLSDAAFYAHVRSAIWQNAARQYNVKRDNPVEIAYPPVGAVKDFLRGKALDPSKTAHVERNNYPVWPCFTKNNRSNAWGLYDMIGNVWEWCTDTENNSAAVICGGSCLCPPEYISPDSKHQFDAQACDVGFRIVIPAK